MVRDAGFSFEIESDDIFGFCVVEKCSDSVFDLIRMLLGLFASVNGGSYTYYLLFAFTASLLCLK